MTRKTLPRETVKAPSPEQVPDTGKHLCIKFHLCVQPPDDPSKLEALFSFYEILSTASQLLQTPDPQRTCREKNTTALWVLAEPGTPTSGFVIPVLNTLLPTQ